MKPCCSTPPDVELDRASAEAFEQHRNRLQRWIPFAKIVRAGPVGAGYSYLEPVRILVYVSATDLEVTTEILSGFFARDHVPNPGSATFVDEGSAPAIVMHVILSGSALDEASQVRNARRDYGGLFGGQEQFATYGISFRRASMDGQKAGKDASLRQAAASV